MMSDVIDQSPRPIQLMLVDADPVFRLGLKVWLEQQGDFTIACEAETATETLEKVRDRFATFQKNAPKPLRRKKAQPILPPLDLVILDLDLGTREDITITAIADKTATGQQLCQQLKSEFTDLPIFVLGTQDDSELEAIANRIGADAYGPRSMSVRRLAELIRQAVSLSRQLAPTTIPKTEAVQPATPLDSQTPNSQPLDSASSYSPRPTFINPASARPNSPDSNPAGPTPQGSSAITPSIPGPLTAMRISMRLSGVQQIDQNIAALARQRTGSWLNRAILDGKKRELLAARWLVSAIWNTPGFSDSPRPGSSGPQQLNRTANAGSFGYDNSYSNAASTDWIRMAQQSGYGQSYADMTAARYLDREALIPAASAALDSNRSAIERAATDARLQRQPTDVQNVVFEGVFAKLQRPLKNVSDSPLEIDILRPDKKLELLYLVLRQLEALLTDLRASTVQPGQLPMRSTQIIQDLWDAVNTEFFGKYYTVRIGNIEEEVVTLLQREKPFVQAQILDRIPMVPELLGHWLFQEPMMIDGAPYFATTQQAIAYSERLLENLMIQVANAVVQPLLNRLADVESIKKSLYNGRLMSSREIERFRNDLSWRYRLDRFVAEPKAIFESRYNLHVLTPAGINQTSVYAPRRNELDRLGGIPLVVTLAMETRDAISPRLRTAISLVGSSVVYVLTEVLGRGIGLVGRGILKGVGNAWQDTKGKPGKQQRKQKPVYPDPPRESGNSQRPYTDNLYEKDLNEWE